MKKFFTDITWPKLVLLLVVILILTNIVAPDTAQWIITPIIDLSRSAIEAVQNLGG